MGKVSGAFLITVFCSEERKHDYRRETRDFKQEQTQIVMFICFSVCVCVWYDITPMISPCAILLLYSVTQYYDQLMLLTADVLINHRLLPSPSLSVSLLYTLSLDTCQECSPSGAAFHFHAFDDQMLSEAEPEPLIFLLSISPPHVHQLGKTNSLNPNDMWRSHKHLS